MPPGAWFRSAADERPTSDAARGTAAVRPASSRASSDRTKSIEARVDPARSAEPSGDHGSRTDTGRTIPTAATATPAHLPRWRSRDAERFVVSARVPWRRSNEFPILTSARPSPNRARLCASRPRVRRSQVGNARRRRHDRGAIAQAGAGGVVVPHLRRKSVAHRERRALRPPFSRRSEMGVHR